LKIEMGLESLFSLFVRLGGERLVTLGEEDKSGRGPTPAGICSFVCTARLPGWLQLYKMQPLCAHFPFENCQLPFISIYIIYY